ncbi:hypothetical protein MRB53_034169 [Persea americana]|uniref:Uncharacterized protein n=1 Tax=Persea americana TaxID=3435 RepID=A0ACC2KWR2_PERAE|nr:hypothetical protein MRB53_034169 [Persea americana]
MPPRRRPANEIPVEEAYARDRMTRLEQQMEMLMQQFQAFMAYQNHQNHNAHDAGDDFEESDDSQEAPRRRRRVSDPPIEDRRRWEGGMCTEIQDTVNSFDPVSILAAHQRALQVEKQLMRRSNSGVAGNPSSSSFGGVHRSSGQQASSNPTQTNKTINSGIKCFGCGEIGHRQSGCKKTCKKALFAVTDDGEEDDAYVGEEPAFDDTPDEEILEADTGPLLIVRRTCEYYYEEQAGEEIPEDLQPVEEERE